MRTGGRWKLWPFGHRHHTGLAWVASSVANAMPGFLSASHKRASPGRSLPRLVCVLTPLLHVGQLASFCIDRGER
jgi:hypothetical protein